MFKRIKTTTKNVIKKGTNECVKNKFVDFLHKCVELIEVRGVGMMSRSQVVTQSEKLINLPKKFLKNKANDKNDGKSLKK